MSTRIASLMLQIGVVVCVLVLVPLHIGSGPATVGLIEAKDLVLDLIGITTASLCLVSAPSLAIDRTDLFLCLFLIVSAISGAFAATDRWEALRATGLTISGAAVFWSSRFLARQGRRRPLLDALVAAIALVSMSVLIDSFGYGLDYPVAASRGTQGNRNWAGHLLALGMPLLALRLLAGETARRRTVALCALAISTAALVMTRSRAAWLAAIVGTALPLVVLTVDLPIFRVPVLQPRRCVLGLSALLAGVVLGVCLPTQLRWSSSNPYRESATSMFAYSRGSGEFRLEQDQRSLVMAADHLALGVGPGNWRIVYPGYLPQRMPLPPRLWYPRMANNEWITLAAERGTPAAILFFAFLVSLGLGCWRSFLGLRGTPSGSERSLEPLCAIAIVAALAVIGSLDAVLQLAAPTLVFFLAAGTLAPQRESIASGRLSRGVRTLAIAMSVLVAAVISLQMLDRMYAMSLLARGGDSDQQAAFRIAVDADWLYNEKLWLWFRLKRAAEGNSDRRP